MRKAKFDASIILIIAIVLLLSGGITAAILTLRSDPVGEAISGDRVINVLFVIEKNNKPLSAYVLMYYPATRRAAIFDIPGDLGLIIKRINRVDRIDRVYDSRKITEYQHEVQGLLGVDINFSMVISDKNLGKIVDLLEGVEIFIPARIDFTIDKTYIILPSGIRRLDGDKAALYACFTNPDEDREAIVFRHQRFFLALLKRLGEMNNFLKNPAVAQVFQSLITTDIRGRARTQLFDSFASMDIERISVQSVGGIFREVSGQTLLLPYYDGTLIKEIVRQTLGGLTRQIEGTLGDRIFTVEVLNGTVTNGLAGRTAELLKGFGYDIISTGNANNNSYDKTIIIDRSGHEGVAKEFADIIRCRNIRSEAPLPDESGGELTMQNIEYRSDFTLIIGKDFDGRYVTN